MKGKSLEDGEEMTGALVANYDSGEGEVLFEDDFLDNNWLMRADLLKDWIYCLTLLYNEALDENRQTKH